MEETNMKKIIATVLAMVMALALCTTAFAADNYDLYLANSTNISGKVIAANGAVAEKTNKTITITAAASYSDGTGNLEYLTDADGVIYVKTTTPTVADYAVTVTGKKDILFYVTKVDAAPMYAASAKAFTDFGYKCGQVVNNDNSKYYEITTGADAGKVYKATDNGPLSVLVDGKLVKLDNTSAAAVKEHNWSVSASKVENGKVIPTEAVCGICGSKSTAIYETGKAPAGSKVETLNGVTGYVVVPNGTSTTPTTGTTNKSPKTFDAGIAMYVGMALTSVAGSAVVIGKKKEF
jgi:uncharacterized protein YaiE (UPF0345 family)